MVMADHGKHGGKAIHIKDIVDKSHTKLKIESILRTDVLKEWECISKVGTKVASYDMLTKDQLMNVIVETQWPYCQPI